MPVGSARQRGRVFTSAGLTMVLCVFAVIAHHRAWSSSLLMLLGVGPLLKGLLLGRARVVVARAGITLHAGGLRRDSVRWKDLRRVEIARADPTNGAGRLPRARRAGAETPADALNRRGPSPGHHPGVWLLRLHRKGGQSSTSPELSTHETVTLVEAITEAVTARALHVEVGGDDSASCAPS